jgi:hypothetical protein
MLAPWKLSRNSHYELEVVVYAVSGGEFWHRHTFWYPLVFRQDLISCGLDSFPGLFFDNGRIEQDLAKWIDNSYGEAIFGAINESSEYAGIYLCNGKDTATGEPIVIHWAVARFAPANSRTLWRVTRGDADILATTYKARNRQFVLIRGTRIQDVLLGPFLLCERAEAAAKVWVHRHYPIGG